MSRQREIFRITLMSYFHEATSSNILDMFAVIEFVLDTLNDFFCCFSLFACFLNFFLLDRDFTEVELMLKNEFTPKYNLTSFLRYIYAKF